jgi:ParB family transcriptional regulator, chromosome partitioning protein
MPKQRFGLGRGLDALIPGATAVSDDVPMDSSLANSALFEVLTAMISPNPQQPRMPQSDDQQLFQLVDSIKQFGLLQPLLVRLDAEDEEGSHYQLIAGERRWRAARMAGLETVPVVIREATPLLMLEIALVENLQRADLNPLEEAQGYHTLIEEYHFTHDQVAERVGRNRATVSNTLRLLQLPIPVREALITMPEDFTEGHARAVLQVPGDAQRIELTQTIISQHLSVRQAEDKAREINQNALGVGKDKLGGQQHQQSYAIRQLEEEFRRAVEMQVKLQRSTKGKGKGSLTLYFSNEDQLQRLYDLLVGPQGDITLDALSGNGSGHVLDSLLGSAYARVDDNGE